MEVINNTTHPLWLIVMALSLSIVPILVGVTTSYLKVSIVLGMLRSGLGAQQVPGNMVIMSLSLVVTLFVMGPVIKESSANLAQQNINLSRMPTDSEITALASAISPWHEFLKKHAGEIETKTLMSIREAKEKSVEEKSLDTRVVDPVPSPEVVKGDPDITILLTSFMLTELKEAFSMGFVLLLPFLVIDLIVSNILVGMGMFMVSPAMITLPLKLMLFIACDGWMLLTKGLVMSYV